MSNVVGIRFKQAGKVYYFDPAEKDPELNDYVVVETTHGEDLGRVVVAPTQVLTSEITEPLKQIVRKATDEDIQRADELREKGKHLQGPGAIG